MKTKTRFGLFLAPDTGGEGGGVAAAIETGGEGDAGGTGLFSGGLKIGEALASVAPPAADLTPEKKEEVKNPPPAEPKKETPPAKKLPHQHFQELQASRDKAQKELEDERAARKAEKEAWEAERQKLSTPAVPEDFQKQFDALKAEKERMEKDFQAAIVQRTIQAEYLPKRNSHVEKLSAIAKANGEDGVLQAIARWDYDALAEFGDSLTSASQKRDWNRAIDAVAEIDEQIAEKSKNVEGGWEELQRKAQEQTVAAQKERVQRNVVLAESLYTKMTEALPELKNAPELATKVRADMVAMAGGEGNSKFTAEQVLQRMGEYVILSEIVTQQTGKIKELTKALAEKEAALKKHVTGFTHDHVDPDLGDGEDKGTGLFSGGIVVRGR
jgi:hypothetical protein